jgi:hypothetical protein
MRNFALILFAIRMPKTNVFVFKLTIPYTNLNSGELRKVIGLLSVKRIILDVQIHFLDGDP